MSGKRRWTGGPAPLWSCPPPPPRVRKYPRLKILPGPATELVIVSSRLEETRTHHIDGRTAPCTGEQGQCWVDHAECGGPRYVAWLAVKFGALEAVHLLPLTPIAVAVEPRLRDAGVDLRGLVLKVWRKGNHERSEMNARLLVDGERVLSLPECPDVRFAVRRMWEADDRPKSGQRATAGILQRAMMAQGGAK